MNNKKLIIIVSAGVFLVLACIASVLGVMLFMRNPATNNDTTPTPTTSATSAVTPTITDTATPTVSGTPTPPAGWDAIENTKYGYVTYRPHGWYYRIFSGQDMIGIAPSAIPEAAEYGGAIVVLKLDNPTQMIADTKANLMPGYTDTTRVINGRTWEIIVGQQNGGGVFDDNYAKYGIFTQGSNTYWVMLVNANADYGGHADEFETVITSIWFK